MKRGAQYRNLPIRQKLRLIIMATVATALILACAAFLVYDQIALRDSVLASTAVTAEMIGSNSTGALSFGDRKAASELLSTLRAQRSMVAADCIGRQCFSCAAVEASASRRPGQFV